MRTLLRVLLELFSPFVRLAIIVAIGFLLVWIAPAEAENTVLLCILGIFFLIGLVSKVHRWVSNEDAPPPSRADRENPRTPEGNIPNVLAALARTVFMMPDTLKQIRKLKLPKEDEDLVRAGLIGLGMYVVVASIRAAVPRVVSNVDKADRIINQITRDIQDAFVQQLLDDKMTLDFVSHVHDFVVLPLFDDVGKYLRNAQESYPGSKWGILSVVLWRALGEEKAHRIVSDFFKYMEVSIYFNSVFTESIRSFLNKGEAMADQIDSILRSPMGSPYSIS